jgi:creatinine amidohydrolase/Fe(II)-dependent formamide hydrolase-like protein
LTARYVSRFVNSLVDRFAPAAVYVVDVHGSIAHRGAIQDGLRASGCARWAFRWLHEPLAEFGSNRGDTHAGGVETALVYHLNAALVDPYWWPARTDELAAAQMTTADAIELSRDLSRFITRVETEQLNGIVGDVRQATQLDAAGLMNRMLHVAREDIAGLLAR